MKRAIDPLPGAPPPYPDELLYSVLARTSRSLGLSSPKLAAEVMLGSRNALAVPDLPTRLGIIEQWASEQWRLSMGDLVMRHTTAPYYAAHRGMAAYRNLVRAMRGHRRGLHLALGICTSVVADTVWFRMCPQCAKEDIARRGETYWRRTHQLPGVLVCHIHHEALFVTSVPYRSPRRNPLILASPRLLTQAHSWAARPGPFPALATELAVRLARLCAAAPQEQPNVQGYRDRLIATGYGGSGSVEGFTCEMASFIGPTLQCALFRSDTDSVAWMRAAARTPRRPLHPVVHALMELFLEHHAGRSSESPRSASRGRRRPKSSQTPSLRLQAAQLAVIGYTTAAIARVLEVDRQTAKRLQQPLAPLKPRPQPAMLPSRQRWLALAKAHPSLTRSQLRALEPALYTRLYRFDRVWLMQHGPCRCAPRRAAPRIDWVSRDTRLSEGIRNCADRLRTEDARKRASANRVLGDLRARSLMRRYARHMPRATATLRQCCETVAAHQIRRVAAAIKQGGADRCDWQILRAAGINPDRFADGGKRLIELGRGQSTL